MKILIVYGTNSSGTLEASEIIQDVFRGAGHTTKLLRADHVDSASFSRFDIILLGSCSWGLIAADGKWLDGQLQEHVLTLQKHLQGKSFPGSRFGIFGLGDRRYSKFCASVDHLEALVREIGGQQTGPALRIDGYFFHLPENRKRVREWASTIMAQSKASVR